VVLGRGQDRFLLSFGISVVYILLRGEETLNEIKTNKQTSLQQAVLNDPVLLCTVNRRDDTNDQTLSNSFAGKVTGLNDTLEPRRAQVQAERNC
jgi:hypothetical protein